MRLSDTIESFIKAMLQEDQPEVEQTLLSPPLPFPVRLTPGGSTRQQSVSNGLALLRHCPDDIVLVHDGARCFVSAAVRFASHQPTPEIMSPTSGDASNAIFIFICLRTDGNGCMTLCGQVFIKQRKQQSHAYRAGQFAAESFEVSFRKVALACVIWKHFV